MEQSKQAEKKLQIDALEKTGKLKMEKQRQNHSALVEAGRLSNQRTQMFNKNQQKEKPKQ
jgi:hypothetical protein